MADEVGLATLTLSALVERLGVRQPSSTSTSTRWLACTATSPSGPSAT